MKKFIFISSFYFFGLFIGLAQITLDNISSNLAIDPENPSVQLVNITLDAGAGFVIQHPGYNVKGGASFVFNIGKYYQVGPGFGLRYYKYRNGTRERTRISFFLDNRIFFTETKAKPYLRLVGGYGKDFDFDRLSGFVGTAGIGIWIRTNELLAVYFEINADYDDLGAFNDLGAISFILGIALGG